MNLEPYQPHPKYEWKTRRSGGDGAWASGRALGSMLWTAMEGLRSCVEEWRRRGVGVGGDYLVENAVEGMRSYAM
jgi:hypothetical protein